VVALVFYSKRVSSSSNPASSPTLPTSAASIAGIHCNTTEQLVYHQHAKLDIYVHGKHFQIPPFIGIPGTANCLYWMHTHALNQYPQGVIHMEFPGTKPSPPPTLLRFFRIWQATRSDDDAPVATILRGGPNVHIYVNRKPYLGTVSSIVLHPHELVTIEIGTPYVKPPTFNFNNPQWGPL
jgi:hypothetical protein